MAGSVSRRAGAGLGRADAGDHGDYFEGVGAHPAAWVLLAVSTALMLWTRLNPLLLMCAGGVIGFFGLI